MAGLGTLDDTPHNANPAMGSVWFETGMGQRKQALLSGKGLRRSGLLRPTSDGVLLVLIDVSGHGTSANKLALTLEEALQNTPEQEPAPLLQLLHQHCIGTRGAAAGIALVNCERGELSYAGIGNTRICLRGHDLWRGISRDGVLGERFPTPLLQRQPMEPGDVLMLYSDGISESLNLRDGALDLGANPPSWPVKS